MSHSRLALLVIGVVLLAQAVPVAAVPTPAGAQPIVQATAAPVCNGKFKGHLKPSPDQLAEILKQHSVWLSGYALSSTSGDSKLANDPKRANLCDADLNEAHLEGAYLDGAHLEGADLVGAHLAGAHLYRANLTGANLAFANLTGAALNDAYLEGADLTYAHLVGAHLNSADLTSANLRQAHLNSAELMEAKLVRADLTGADLRDAYLFNAHLDGADLAFADVAAADFDFDPDSPPKAVPGIYTVRNLQLVKFQDQPAGLVKLRGELKDLGLRTQEAQLTYAIRRSELSREIIKGRYVHSWSERALNTIFFDWTCQYGMSPGRPLGIVAVLAAILSIVYIFAQVDPGPNGGIWAVWDEHRIKHGEGSSEPQQLTDGFPSGRSQISFLLLAFYFSLLSATRIGWHELNVGTWITRIQPREYTLRATGWVRVVSGVQSLISVYLVALAILTYFGTPFEY